MNITSACAFLYESAKYFEALPTQGEDSVHWANVQNAENCRQIALMLEEMAYGIEVLAEDTASTWVRERLNYILSKPNQMEEK